VALVSFRIAPMGFSVDFRSDDTGVEVGPHQFVAIGRWRNWDKCRACYLPRQRHPTTGWTIARPLGDKQ
jgi:hypothetical protein